MDKLQEYYFNVQKNGILEKASNMGKQKYITYKENITRLHIL